MKELRKYFEEEIKSRLENLNFEEQITLFNAYCNDANYTEDGIYHINEIDDLYCDRKPTDILQDFSDFNINNSDWFYYDGCANPQSLNSVDDVADWDYVADYMIDYTNSFNESEFDELLELWDNLDSIKSDIADEYFESEDEDGNFERVSVERVLKIIDDTIYIDEADFLCEEFINDLIDEAIEEELR